MRTHFLDLHEQTKMSEHLSSTKFFPKLPLKSRSVYAFFKGKLFVDAETFGKIWSKSLHIQNMTIRLSKSQTGKVDFYRKAVLI